MPPKRVAKPKLHQLAAELPPRTMITDPATKKQFCIGKQFATGGFGRIYTCTEVGTKTELVVKVEPQGNGPLFTEMNVFLRILKPEQIEEFLRERKLKRLGVPSMISFGMYQHGNEKLRFLVMPKYATSLEMIREKRKTLTQNEVWTVAKCVLQSLEYIHEKNYVHADIKAANILLEKLNDFSTSVLVDYGLARMSSSNEDKPDKKRAHNGTAMFTSCDAHRGCHPSYRGDLEILAYNMVYWLSGTLPWEKYESNPEEVHQMKRKFLKDLPSSLKDMLKSSPGSVSPLKEIFGIAQKTKYAEQLEYSKLYKIADDVLRGEKAVKRKTPTDDTPEVEVKKSKTVITKKDATPRNRNSEDGCAVRTRVGRREVLKSKVDTPSSSTSSPLSATRSQKTARNANCCSSSSSAEQTESPKTLARDHEKQLLLKRNKKLQRLKAGGIVPGLTVRRAPCLPSRALCSPTKVPGSPSHGQTSSSKSSKDSKEATVEARTNGACKAGVSPGVKGSPRKLRSVPGMSNFARGRRSIVIDQINKKYKRIAEKKKKRLS